MSERPNDSPDEPIDKIEPETAEAAADEVEPDDATHDTIANEIDDADDFEGVEAAVDVRRPMRPSERRAHRAGTDGSKLHVDPSTRIMDRASAIFVLVTLGVFVLILLNGMLLGRGGLLTPIPTPGPVPSITAAPRAAPAPTATPAPTASPAPTATPSPAPTAAPAPSAT